MCTGEVADRHNVEYKNLGEIKCKTLAICKDAEDKPGYMLTNDMVLKGLQACAAT